MGWWLWKAFYDVEPRLNYLEFKKNGETVKILKGESIRLHPKDTIRIIKIFTNLPFNHGVRLVASGLDATALLYESMPLSTLLPKREIYQNYQFKVEVKKNNQNLGHFNLLVEPHTDDWLEKADRTIDLGRRIKVLEKARQLHPEDTRIRDNLIATYKAIKNWQQVALMLEDMAEEKPDQSVLQDLLETYKTLSDTEKSVSVLKRLIALNPDDMELQYRLAETFEKAGKRNEAINAYEDLLNRLESRERLPIYKILGYLYTETDQPEKAISAYLKAVELDPSEVNLYYNLADLYERTNQKERSDYFLGKAVGLKKEDLDGRLKLAESLAEKGRLEDAEKHLSEILKKNPKSVRALLLSIKIMEKRGDKKTLKKLYKNLVPLDPNNETIIYNLGVLEYETGQFEQSRPYFERLGSYHKKDSEIHGFLFDIYQKTEKRSLAYREAQILVRLKPKETTLYPFIFDYLNQKGNYKEIINTMKRALKTHPNRLDLREYLIVGYLKSGQEDKAAENIKRILKIRPKSISWLLHLARLEEKQGKIKEAIRVNKKILDISPDHGEARDAYIRLMLAWAKGMEEKEDFKEALAAYKNILDVSPVHEEAEEAYLRLRLKALPIGSKEE